MILTATKKIEIVVRNNDACKFGECQFCIADEEHYIICALYNKKLEFIRINDFSYEKRLQECKDDFGTIKNGEVNNAASNA